MKHWKNINETIYDEDGRKVALVSRYHVMRDTKTDDIISQIERGDYKANARLIAAAPELLKALLEGSEWISLQLQTANDDQISDYDRELLISIRAAIQKATGDL